LKSIEKKGHGTPAGELYLVHQLPGVVKQRCSPVWRRRAAAGSM
jgi:hypothetical protein